MSIARAEYRQTTSIVADLDSYTTATTTTENNGGEVGSARAGGAGKGTRRNRYFVRIPNGDTIVGKIHSARLKLAISTVATTPTQDFECYLLDRARAKSIVEGNGTAASGITDAKYDTTNDWSVGRTDTDGTGTISPGHDTITTNAVKGIPIPDDANLIGAFVGSTWNSESSEIEDNDGIDVTAMVQAAVDAIRAGSYAGADAPIGFMLCGSNEVADASASAGGCTLYTVESAPTHPAPTLVIEFTPPPYDYMICEAEETVSNSQTTKADIGGQCGTLGGGFSGGETVTLYLADVEDGEWTGLYTSYDVVDLTTITKPGEMAWFRQVDIAGSGALKANGCYRFYLQWAVGGETYDGEVRECLALPGANDEDWECRFEGDHHWIEARNAGTGGLASIIVQTATYEKYRIARDRLNRPLAFVVQLGDGDGYIFNNADANLLCPLATDGSGLSDSPTLKYAVSAEDPWQAIRAWNVNTEYPLWVDRKTVMGNHEGVWWHGHTANNGGITDIAQWVYDAHIAFGRIPPTADYGEYSGNGHMAEYAVGVGKALLIVANAFKDSIYSGVISGAPIPRSMNAVSDWKFSTETMDWLFDPDTGVITNRTQPKVLFAIHHTLGGTDTGVPGKYARYSHSLWYVGFMGDSVQPELESDTADLKDNFLGLSAHDHQFDKWSKNRINWIEAATPGQYGVQGANPYNSGIVNFSTYTLHDEGQRKDNAGSVRVTVTSKKITAQYIATLVSTSESGTEYLNAENSALYAAGYTDGDVVATVTVGSGHTGRSRSRGRGRSWD